MRHLRVMVFVLLGAAGTLAQQPVRDVPTPGQPGLTTPKGTSTIAGVVRDERAQPIRRARVTMVSVDRSGVARTATTDDAGRFGVGDLPAGRYNVQATKNAWLPANFGARRQGRPGTPVAVTDGQRVTGLSITMVRGAVVAGTVRGEDGQGMANLTVSALQFSTRNGLRSLGGERTATSDDTGAYRIYGLPPGDFVLLVKTRPDVVDSGPRGVETRQTMPGDVQRALQLARSSGAPPTGATPPEPSRSTQMVDYSPIYYPGTADPATAETLHLAAAEERTGLDLTFRLTPTVRVEGTIVMPSGMNAQSYQLQVKPAGDEFTALDNITNPRTDKDGRFVVSGLAPGRYTFLAGGGAPADGPRGPGTGPTRLVGFAALEVTVGSQNLELSILLRPPATLGGRAVFEGETPAATAGIQIALMSPFERSIVTTSLAGTTGGPVTFSFQSLPHGKYVVSYVLPRQSPWFVKSMVTGGSDVFGEPFELQSDVTDLVVTFTDRPSEVTGRLEDASGRAATDYFIIVFPEDRTKWTPTTRRIQSTRPGIDGGFAVKGLPAGTYFIGALTDVEPGEWFSPAFLDQIAPLAQKVTVMDAQKTVVNLRLSGR